jgi:hypothetical protein
MGTEPRVTESSISSFHRMALPVAWDGRGLTAGTGGRSVQPRSHSGISGQHALVVVALVAARANGRDDSGRLARQPQPNQVSLRAERAGAAITLLGDAAGHGRVALGVLG